MTVRPKLTESEVAAIEATAAKESARVRKWWKWVIVFETIMSLPIVVVLHEHFTDYMRKYDGEYAKNEKLRFRLSIAIIVVIHAAFYRWMRPKVK